MAPLEVACGTPQIHLKPLCQLMYLHTWFAPAKFSNFDIDIAVVGLFNTDL